jgi:hypothetical protein
MGFCVLVVKRYFPYKAIGKLESLPVFPNALLRLGGNGELGEEEFLFLYTLKRRSSRVQ